MVILRKKALAHGKYSLYLDINNNGKRYYEFLNIHLGGDKNDKQKIKIAEEIRLKREFELINGTYISAQSMKISFYDFFDRYKDSFPRKAEKDVLVNYHMKKVSPKLSFEEINADYWKMLKSYFISIGHKPYTIYTSCSTLKAMLNAAVKLEIIPKHNFNNVHEKKPDTHREHLILSELMLLEATECRKPEIKNAFMFCCFTGLRLSDIKELTYGDIKNGQIEIRQKKTKNFVYIPLSKQSLKYLPEQGAKADNEKIFRHVSKSTIYSIIKEWVATAGIKKNIMFHTSRHTFATLSLTYDVPIEVVSSLLGHKDIKTTQIYAKIIDSKKIEAIEKLPEF